MENTNPTSNNIFIEYADGGLTGLANVGNTCYLNSCVQVLSHTYELNNFLKDVSYKSKLKHNCPDSLLIKEWDNLRMLMWSENCTIAPNGFVQAIKQVARAKDVHVFTGNDQNDVSEFLLFLIDSFHTSLSREVDMEIRGQVKNSLDTIALKCYEMMKTMYSKEYSELLDIFFGISLNQIKSIESGNVLNCVPEPYCIVGLSIPQNMQSINIFNCFDEYCKKEIMDNENAYLNDKTGKKENVEKRTLFWNLPKILIIELKRYNAYGKKINNLVQFPLEDVDFSPYVVGYNKQSYVYDLYGVFNHSGGTLGGHYTAIVKNANGKWYEFNDTIIEEVAQEKVISQKSYCFFYRKKNR
jgi:ubiquitin C-terminal hydrolase